MLKSIQKQAEELKARARQRAGRHDEQFRIGAEIEVCLLDGRARPVDAAPVIEALSAKHQVDHEYGQSQLEFRTDPVSMGEIESLNLQFEDFVGDLDRALNKIDSDAVPVFLGANPSPHILKGSVTDKPRYRRLERWQSRMPDIEIDGHKFPAPQVATAIQGFHMHLQGRDPGYTAQMFNHILNLIPSIILLGANSRLFAGRVLSLHEPRIFMYDQSERQNSGFPGIPRYLAGAEDYIDYIASRKPVIAKDYFGLVKERHDDARIRMNTGFYRVETRVMSVQPTPRTMMAMIEFFIGYLNSAIHEGRELRPLAALREERQSVVRSGFGAKSHFSVTDTAKSQLAFARKGLQDLGVKAGFLGVLESRIENRTTAGEHVARLWQSAYGGDAEKAVAEVIADVWEKTRHNKPIT
ncbi:carboxylate-amine ligase [Candidatus Nitrososphaera sp. FF02]|uniref:carboxylate-amine ligase n=1 Tax=Candidatus Nitrososphaera sp. FF02 TaxID=3398226 RepID=UPI0039EA31EB